VTRKFRGRKGTRQEIRGRPRAANLGGAHKIVSFNNLVRKHHQPCESPRRAGGCWNKEGTGGETTRSCRAERWMNTWTQWGEIKGPDKKKGGIRNCKENESVDNLKNFSGGVLASKQHSKEHFNQGGVQ